MDPVNEVVEAQYKIAHGVLAGLAWIVFFPAGAINIRLFPARYAVMIHVAIQFFAYALFITAAGLGIKIALVYNVDKAGLLMKAHSIIGLVILALIFFQPFLGYLHHTYFNKYSRRTVWSYAHVWLGRILITMAIIDGGLGLRLTAPDQPNSTTGEIVYGAVSGVVWCVYMSVAVYGEVKKATAPEALTKQSTSASDSVTSFTAESEKHEMSNV